MPGENSGWLRSDSAWSLGTPRLTALREEREPVLPTKNAHVPSPHMQERVLQQGFLDWTSLSHTHSLSQHHSSTGTVLEIQFLEVREDTEMKLAF